MPNDHPPVTDLSFIRATANLPKARSSVRRIAPVALALGALGVAAVLRSRGRYQFADKVVVITGGSRGLGLVLARELASHGAALGLLARDAIELARARRTIDSGSLVQLLPADVTDAAQVERAFSTMLRRFGRIDVVINNAGQILSAPFHDTTPEDFKAMLDVHFWGTLNVTRAALPHLARHGDGRIINICSIGARIPIPHLSAYCASKYAQAGLSAVMAEELRAKGIRVTTVLPGLMRTGSHLHAWFKGERATEFALFSLLAGSPGTSMSAERAARLILDASARGRADAVIPFTVRQIAKWSAWFPNATVKSLASVNALIPEGRARVATQGRHLPLPAAVRGATALNERAADRNNQR
ncbi:MAG TPA: SDR family oxidoreductase [Steroidobacteraceae bacterium]|nr:SDR family oxidoreductase [Steroidobacteraceae bacterium]